MLGKVYSMTIKYLDSKRLEGVEGDLTTKSLTSGNTYTCGLVNSWKEEGI